MYKTYGVGKLLLLSFVAMAILIIMASTDLGTIAQLQSETETLKSHYGELQKLELIESHLHEAVFHRQSDLMNIDSSSHEEALTHLARAHQLTEELATRISGQPGSYLEKEQLLAVASNLTALTEHWLTYMAESEDLLEYTHQSLVNLRRQITSALAVATSRHEQASSLVQKSTTARAVGPILLLGLLSLVFLRITRRSERKIFHLAFYDQLTGLAKGDYFLELISAGIRRCRAHRIIGLITIEIHSLDRYNRIMGSSVCASLQEQYGKRLKLEFPQPFVLGKLGEETFGILTPELPHPDDIISVAQQVLRISSEPLVANEHRLMIESSVGVSIFPDHAREAHVLATRSTQALHYAREIGLKGYALFDPIVEAAIAHETRLEEELRKAMQDESFTLVYQPVVATETEEILGFEALVRWSDSDGASIPPNEFIPLAEKLGYIVLLGDWILKTACLQLRSWQEQGHSHWFITVNVSPIQLKQADFVSTVTVALEQAGLSPESLMLEITEDVLIDDEEYIISVLEQLKRMGITIALDDFGTGYSSLRYLTALPLDILKIDKSFIDMITCDPAHDGVVDQIISLARKLDLQVIGEGVEVKQQVEFLKLRRVQMIQGYYFSKPLNASKVTKGFKLDKHRCNRQGQGPA